LVKSFDGFWHGVVDDKSDRSFIDTHSERNGGRDDLYFARGPFF
jgi:hypothetical protein